MTTNTMTGPIRKNGSTHVMLLILKFYGRPITFNDMYEIAPKKINVNNRRRCTAILIEKGLAVETVDAAGESWFTITPAGVAKVYDMADKNSR